MGKLSGGKNCEDKNIQMFRGDSQGVDCCWITHKGKATSVAICVPSHSWTMGSQVKEKKGWTVAQSHIFYRV